MNLRSGWAKLWGVGLLGFILGAGCTQPTPVPGALETVVAATVAAGGTHIAQVFADQRLTLTAGAPTLTFTPPATATPTFTALPSDTATPAFTPTRTPRPATPTRTLPPPPTATATPAPVANGTYFQSGGCEGRDAWAEGDVYGRTQTYRAGTWQYCITAVVVQDTLTLIQATWTLQQIQGPYYGARGPDRAYLRAWNGTSHGIYLTDNLGQRYDFVDLSGAARDGGSGSLHDSISGTYIFPAIGRGVSQLFLFDADLHSQIPLQITTVTP